MITLFFTKYWYIGLLILIVSLITAFQLSDDFIEKSKYDKTIKSYLTVDGIVSLSLLFVIIFKQLLLKQ